MMDVVIGTVSNYGWEEIAPFAISLERSGFDGHKVMFAENVSNQAVYTLGEMGWEVIPAISDKSQNYATARHFHVRNYLDWHNARFVIYADVRDAVFQSNPVPWLEANLDSKEIVGPSECILIGDQPTNSAWIENCLSPGAAKWLGGHDVLCCGTIVGTHEAVYKAVSWICQMAEFRSGWGYDQAYFNYLLRRPPLKDKTRIVRNSDGFIATLSWYLSAGTYPVNDLPPVLDRESVSILSPITNEPFPIVHQYDRDPWWADAIRRKYS